MEGLLVRLSTGDDATGLAQCFANPVNHDVVGPDGLKVAGAGQRRTRRGLLHQGSVAGRVTIERSRQRGETLACCLADNWSAVDYDPPAADIAQRVTIRYGHPDWTARRLAAASAS